VAKNRHWPVIERASLFAIACTTPSSGSANRAPSLHCRSIPDESCAARRLDWCSAPNSDEVLNRARFVISPRPRRSARSIHRFKNPPVIIAGSAAAGSAPRNLLPALKSIPGSVPCAVHSSTEAARARSPQPFLQRAALRNSLQPAGLAKCVLRKTRMNFRQLCPAPPTRPLADSHVIIIRFTIGAAPSSHTDASRVVISATKSSVPLP